MDTGALSHRIGRSRWFGLAVGTMVLVAWAWFLSQQLTALRAYSWQLSPLRFILSVGWGACYFGTLAFCWAFLLRALSPAARATSPAVGASAWLSSMLTRYIPGNVWHIVARVAYAGRLGVTHSQILSSATVEQVLTLLGALALFALSLPFWHSLPGEQLWLLVLLPLGLLALHPLLLGRVLAFAAQRLKRPELAWPYRYREMLLLLLGYLIAHACSGLALYTVLGGLTVVERSEIIPVLGMSALAWVIGYISFLTPSGLGVREAVLTALLATLYPLPIAIVASLLYRLVTTLGEVLAAAIAFRRGSFAHVVCYYGQPEGELRWVRSLVSTAAGCCSS
ncbi:hypothetical protein HC891_09320 [Candidatus Gracilibacteria bacterium]|nr:hypothetical protein [Candidatus Gracilibacteria bacterium]